MADEPIPDDFAAEDIRELVAILDKLFSTAPADDHGRYVATKLVLWQTIAGMMIKGADDKAALQIVLSAGAELLARAVGPAGAAAHLRLMGDKVATLQRH